ncbi:hypothetical protein [Nitrososphaera sp.]|uniref:hypothetical protein n=1 Tax=Nitrososphaera sp. TaxID=1971748 RepID=UPI00307DF798
MLQRPVLRRLFDALDEGTLKAIAEAAARESSEIRILMVGEDTLAAYYKVLRGRLRKSGFAFTEATDGRVRRFTIRHDMGRKWSYFFKHHYEAMIAGVGYPSRVSFTDDTLVIEVDESRAGFDSNNNDGLRL